MPEDECKGFASASSERGGVSSDGAESVVESADVVGLGAGGKGGAAGASAAR